MSDAPELNPSPAKNTEAHPMDALTGGAFSAATPGERAARIRDWLATQPSHDQLQEVFKELSIRDKSAARAVRERLDEIRRTKDQEVIAVEWAEKAQALLAGATLNVSDAVAWQRDAAKAGAPLSREPLAGLKTQLTDRVKTIEDLQHRVQVQREAAVLLAQRIEVLSTKPWRDAAAAVDGLRVDVDRWQAQAAELTGDASWASVNDRFPPQLESSRTQLLVVWDAFQSALSLAQAAADNAQAELPPVPVWADEIRVGRGLPSELAAAAAASSAPAKMVAAKPNKVDAAQKQLAAAQAVQPLLQALINAAAEAKAEAIVALRAVLKQHGRWVDDALAQQVHEQLLAAGDAHGWQPKNVDRLREELIAKAEGLVNRPEGQALGGRKLQESLRQLREQWKQTDQGAAPNHALWKKFDEACNAAYKLVEAWLERVRTEATLHKTARVDLIEEVKAWAGQQAGNTDWKGMGRALRQFGERWRDSGHVGEKAFTELQSQWKQAMTEAEAPLHTAQKTSLDRRHAMIDEAQALADAPTLRIDAVKTLQQRWQVEAQAVPLDRKHEQKLWDAFRKPLDDAFNRKGAERGRAPAEVLSAHDRAVLEAAKALQAANATGDAQQIRVAMTALEEATRAQHQAQDAEVKGQPEVDVAAPAAAAPKADRPVVAVRGDDRPGAKKEAPAAPVGRDGRPAFRKDARPARDGRDSREARPDRGPRLGDTAFRAQRDALEGAQFALRKLAAQAHGEALTKLMDAWSQRDAAALPSSQELGGKVTAQVRNSWSQAVSAPVKADAGEAMLRLEIAADVATPAEQMSARRMLQLQLLTRRNAPAPAETWAQDVATVLASEPSDSQARRLQAALKPLLRK